MEMAIKIFTIISMVLGFWAILPLVFGIWHLVKMSKGEKLTVLDGILSLIFVSPIAGILILINQNK